MQRRSRETGSHLSGSDIADLAAGDMGEIDRAAALAHLEACERCRDAYDYAVRSRDGEYGGPAPDRVALRAARRLRESDYRKRHFDRRGRRRWVVRIGPVGRLILYIVIAALFAVIAHRVLYR